MALEADRKYLGRQVGVHPTSGKRIFVPFGHCDGEDFDIAIARGFKDDQRVMLMMDNRCEAGELVAGNRYPGRLMGIHPTSGKRIFAVGCKNCAIPVLCSEFDGSLFPTLSVSWELDGCSWSCASSSQTITRSASGAGSDCGGYAYQWGAIDAQCSFDCDGVTVQVVFTLQCRSVDGECRIVGAIRDNIHTTISEYVDIEEWDVFELSPLLLIGRGRIGSSFESPQECAGCDGATYTVVVTS